LLNLKKAVHLVPLDTRETREASEERPRMAAARDDDELDAFELLAARRGQHDAAVELVKRRAATVDMVVSSLSTTGEARREILRERGG